MLQTSLDLFLLLRTSFGVCKTSGTVHRPTDAISHARTWLKLEEVWQPYGRQVVSVCIRVTEDKHQSISPQVVRRSLVDLMASGWLFSALVPKGRNGQKWSNHYPADELVQEISTFLDLYEQTVSSQRDSDDPKRHTDLSDEAKMLAENGASQPITLLRTNCKSLRSARTAMVVGLWIMLCLAVLMSAVTAYLMRGQQHREQQPQQQREQLQHTNQTGTLGTSELTNEHEIAKLLDSQVEDDATYDSTHQC
ncbi:unnamed protein product [Echinostoma caproni]|uniref:Transmembrane protein n=1 Tax=Echinostoma caproni TaxID=27848 RepID=A0A183A7L0_9TREM|nr:unnamed protein product [Echinostoma caproni]